MARYSFHFFDTLLLNEIFIYIVNLCRLFDILLFCTDVNKTDVLFANIEFLASAGATYLACSFLYE